MRTLFLAVLFLIAVLAHAEDAPDSNQTDNGQQWDYASRQALKAEEWKLITTSGTDPLQHQYLLFYLRLAYAAKLESQQWRPLALAVYRDCLQKLNTIQTANPKWETEVIALRKRDLTAKIAVLAFQLTDRAVPADEIYDQFIELDMNFPAAKDGAAPWSRNNADLRAPEGDGSYADYLKTHATTLESYQKFQYDHPAWQAALLNARIKSLGMADHP